MAVRDPEMVMAVDEEIVREQDHARAKGLDEIALGVELHHRIERASGAIVGAATFRHPDIALAVAGHDLKSSRSSGRSGSLKKGSSAA